MVVEELQILIGCDASTAERVLTELENRLSRFVKQAGGAFSDTKAIKAQGMAEREALKTEVARARAAAQIEKANASILQTKQRMEQAEQRLQQKVKKTTIDYEEQARRFAEIEKMKEAEASGQTASEYRPPVDTKSLEETQRILEKQNAEWAKLMGKDSPEVDSEAAEMFLKNADAAERYNFKLDILMRKLQRLLGEENNLMESGGTGKALERVQEQILSVTDKIEKMKAKAADSKGFDKLANNARKAAKKTEGVFTRLGNSIKKILTRMIIWRSINAIIMSIEQGFQNMAVASEKANATLSDLMSSFTYAKNAIASAFMPALQAIAPLLNRVAIAFANFANSIGALFAKLRGDSTFTKAVYVQQDFAASLSGSNKAAKELQGTLAGFDQINLIQQQDNSGSAAADAVGGMFEEAEVESNIGKFGQKIFDFFEKVKSKIPQPIIDRFAESIEKLKTAWGNLKDNPVWDKLLNIVAGIVALGASVALSALTRGIEALGAAIQFLDSMLKGDWQGMKEALETIISAPFNLINDLILAIAAAAGASEEDIKKLDEHLRAPTEKQVLLQSDISGFDVGLFKILKDWNANLGAENEKEQMIMTATFKIGGEDGETIEEGWRRFKESCEKGWEDVVTWWQSSALSKWWSEDVAPWFAKEKWVEAVNGIKEGITGKWADIQQWWQNNAISKWWSEDVAPWFTKEKWTTAMAGIKQSWEEIWKGAVNAAIEKINRFIDWVNDKMNIKWEPFKIGGKVIFEGGSIQLFRLNRLPTLADGGIAYGDTLARIGEYANARTNPEVIAPLDKLQSILGNRQDTQTIITLLRRIAEQDNEIALYPSAKLGRIASQSIKMYNATAGAV